MSKSSKSIKRRGMRAVAGILGAVLVQSMAVAAAPIPALESMGQTTGLEGQQKLQYTYAMMQGFLCFSALQMCQWPYCTTTPLDMENQQSVDVNGLEYNPLTMDQIEEEKLALYFDCICNKENMAGPVYTEALLESQSIPEFLRKATMIDTLQILQQFSLSESAENPGNAASTAVEDVTYQSKIPSENTLTESLQKKIEALTTTVDAGNSPNPFLDYLKQVQGVLLNARNKELCNGNPEALEVYDTYLANTEATMQYPEGCQIVSYTLQYLGGEYVWGGETPMWGFDCSGMIKYVFNHFGYTIGRTTEPQYYSSGGLTVEKDELRPGDLVFFHTMDDPYISHVGMYINDRMFVHAASPQKGIICSSLDEPCYASSYVGAKRIPLASYTDDETETQQAAY